MIAPQPCTQRLANGLVQVPQRDAQAPNWNRQLLSVRTDEELNPNTPRSMGIASPNCILDADVVDALTVDDVANHQSRTVGAEDIVTA